MLPGSDLLISCRRNDVTPSNVVDNLLKMTKSKKISITHNSLAIPDSTSSVLSLVNGQLVGLTTLERKGEANIVERLDKSSPYTFIYFTQLVSQIPIPMVFACG